MDETKERERIQEETFQLCKYLLCLRKPPMPEKLFEDDAEGAFTHEGNAYIDQSLAQLCQTFIFNGFIAMLTDDYFQLLREPEQAGEIAREGLHRLHRFLKEYTDLLIKECGLYE